MPVWNARVSPRVLAVNGGLFTGPPNIEFVSVVLYAATTRPCESTLIAPDGAPPALVPDVTTLLLIAEAPRVLSRMGLVQGTGFSRQVDA